MWKDRTQGRERSNGESWGKRNRTLRGENINRTRKPYCKGTRRKGRHPEMDEILEHGCGERSGDNRTQGREGNLGKRTGNESRETCGGPVPIEKQNGDISHGVNREGRQGSNPLGEILPKRPEKWQRSPSGSRVVYPGNHFLWR